MAKEGKQNASATDNIPGLYSLHFAPRVKLDFGLGASCDVIKSSACLLSQRCELACGGRTYQPCEVIGAFTANLLAPLQPCNPANLPLHPLRITAQCKVGFSTRSSLPAYVSRPSISKFHTFPSSSNFVRNSTM